MHTVCARDAHMVRTKEPQGGASTPIFVALLRRPRADRRFLTFEADGGPSKWHPVGAAGVGIAVARKSRSFVTEPGPPDNAENIQTPRQAVGRGLWRRAICGHTQRPHPAQLRLVRMCAAAEYCAPARLFR